MKSDRIWRALVVALTAATSHHLTACGGEPPIDADGAVDAPADVVADTGPAPPPDVPRPGGTPMLIAWNTDAQGYRGMDYRHFFLTCPPMGQYGIVWGTEVYTDNASICTSAVHDRRITIRGGGDVEIVILPGQTAYTSSLGGGGVHSGAWDTWPGSFSFSYPGRIIMASP